MFCVYISTHGHAHTTLYNLKLILQFKTEIKNLFPIWHLLKFQIVLNWLHMFWCKITYVSSGQEGLNDNMFPDDKTKQPPSVPESLAM